MVTYSDSKSSMKELYWRATTQRGKNSPNQRERTTKKRQHKQSRWGHAQNKAIAFQFCTMESVYIHQNSGRMETHEATE